jgi:hypothetical protein
MGDFTLFSGGRTVVSSLGSENGPEGQDGGGPLPTPFDELTADYSSSTDGGLFPSTVNSESLDSWIMNNDPTLFVGSDHVGGFSVNASELWLLLPSNPSVHRTGSRASCSSDESIAAVGRCVMDGDLSSPIATSPGAGSDPGGEPPPQIPNLPGSNPPFGGGAFPSANPIFGSEMIAAQSSFAMTSPSGVIQGTFPPACCDVTPPIVDGASAPTSDFGNPNGFPNFDPPPNFSPPPDPTGTGSLASIGDPQPAPSVPEIPPPAMLLIGFAGLALIGRRRPWRSVRLG